MEDAKQFYKLDSISQQQKSYAEQILLDSINKENFNSLLEIGCGDAHFIRNFMNKDCNCIELSPDMINQAGELGDHIIQGDIADNEIIRRIDKKYDIIAAHYVFMELKENKLKKSFANVRSLLSKDGSFFFTITDPRTRHLMEFDGYKLVFDGEYNYNQHDLPFKVLLYDGNEYVDVGIRDYHNPLDVYDKSLTEAGFTHIKKQDIRRPEEKDNFAVLYMAKS